jgi:hypothetical protein
MGKDKPKHPDPVKAASDKLTEQVKLNLSETMLRDLQDLALLQDKSVSDAIRSVLRLYLYGHAALLPKGQPDGRD